MLARRRHRHKYKQTYREFCGIKKESKAKKALQVWKKGGREGLLLFVLAGTPVCACVRVCVKLCCV